MMQRRSLLGLAGCALAGAISASPAGCTFPTVDYASGGGGASSGGSGGGGCEVPAPACLSAATACEESGRDRGDKCKSECGNDPGCESKCAGKESSELAKCASACDDCATLACDGKATSCN